MQQPRTGLGAVLYLAAVAIVATSEDAAAYLDPGTGSILLQALIGGAMAAAYFLRRHWQSLRSRLRGRAAHSDGTRGDASGLP